MRFPLIQVTRVLRRQLKRLCNLLVSVGNWIVRQRGSLGRSAALVAILSLAWNVCIDTITQRHQLEQERLQGRYQAWQTINSAQGKPGSGGRIQALEDLKSEGISLAGADLSNAWLNGIDLSEAILTNANFENASLSYADLTGANLKFARLAGCNLYGATLEHTILTKADLTQASLAYANLHKTFFAQIEAEQADFTGSNLRYADFGRANLTGSCFQSADLRFARIHKTDFTNCFLARADLSGATVACASFSNAVLWGTKLSSIELWLPLGDICGARIYGIRDAPELFLLWARHGGADESFPPKNLDSLPPFIKHWFTTSTRLPYAPRRLSGVYDDQAFYEIFRERLIGNNTNSSDQ